MRENNSELRNFVSRAAELLLFLFCFFSYIWYLVVKMRFERPTCCIGRGTFCIQVSCSNYSAISPTESLLIYNYTTPKIDHNCHFLFF